MSGTLLLFLLATAVTEGKAGAEMTLPVPKFSKAEGKAAYDEAIALFMAEDFSRARTKFRACVALADTPDDRTLVESMVDNCVAGAELLKAQDLVGRKNLKGAISRAQRALEKYPKTLLRPKLESLIDGCEKTLYLVIEDFEGDWKPRYASTTTSTVRTTTSTYQTVNKDMKYVRHGKQSLKWRVGYSTSYSYYNSILSKELPPVFTQYRYLKFSVYCEENLNNTLRVLLSPEGSYSIYESRIALVPLYRKVGWYDVVLDLRGKPWSNTKTLSLEEVKYVVIQNLGVPRRTLYVDFIHLE